MNPTEEEDYHYRFKVVILGDTKSGKTTFLDSNYIQKYNFII
jgi:GTPase SAR1 family protein